MAINLNNKTALLKNSKILLEHAALLKVKLTEEEELEKEQCEESLYYFLQKAWRYVEGGVEFDGGWHIEAIAEHLEMVADGRIRNLLINIPPRCCKSTLISIAFPAWIWTQQPGKRFLCTSYAQSLSITHSVSCRRLIQSHWYQRLWGKKVRLVRDVNNKSRFENTKRGYRLASSVKGANTGAGADIIIADDPNNIMDVESEVTRDFTNMWWDQIMSTRDNNSKASARIVVQQRTHTMDLSGHIIGKGVKDYVHLYLPMEMELANRCYTVPKKLGEKTWCDPRKKEGQLLWEGHIGQKEVQEKKRNLGPYAYAGQFQQRPAPISGGIIDREWFSHWCDTFEPNVEFVIQSWDTAFTGEATKENKNAKNVSYSACTTWGVFRDKNNIANALLLSAWRGRVEYPDLRIMAQKLYRNYYDTYLDDTITPGPQPDVVLIEAKASGAPLIQDLSRAGVVVTPFNPNRYGDKRARARRVSALISTGRVWVLANPPHFETLVPFAEDFVSQCALFPNGESNDYVDSMSQALQRLQDSGWVALPGEDEDSGAPQKIETRPLYEI